MRKDTTNGSSRREFMQQSGGIALTAALASYLGESTIATAQTTPSDRVTDLVDEMTLEEKVGQMTQMAASEVSDENPAEALRKYKPGSLMYLPSFDPEEVARASDVRQKAMVEDTRLGVPFVYGIDSVHGNNNIEGATIFPHNHGVGATWDANAAEEMASITSRTMRVTGTHWNFSPVADLQRDPRWGRFYEGFSEDPYLASQLVASKVRGYEEKTNGYKRTGASIKHFAGYSAPENGNDRTSALLPYRTFVSTFLPSYAAGITAGAETVMVNSGSLNGVPAHASKELLTDILRDQLGFEGMVVTDWHDFYRMIKVHGFAEDLKEATRLGINAGIDMYMVPAAGIEGDDAEGYQQRLIELVDEGSVSMERIDDAVTNVLAFKENLGLFEDPYAEPSKVEWVVSEGRDLARDVATESMTLLTNDGTLPLGSDAGSILVTGPSADSVTNQMGGWSLGWQGVGDTEPPATTVLDGISEAAPGSTSVTHVPTGLHEFSNEEAVRDAAECADVVVAVLGEGPYAEEQGDTDTLALPDAQRRLVEDGGGDGHPDGGRHHGRASARNVGVRPPLGVADGVPSGNRGGASGRRDPVRRRQPERPVAVHVADGNGTTPQRPQQLPAGRVQRGGQHRPATVTRDAAVPVRTRDELHRVRVHRPRNQPDGTGTGGGDGRHHRLRHGEEYGRQGGRNGRPGLRRPRTRRGHVPAGSRRRFRARFPRRRRDGPRRRSLDGTPARQRPRRRVLPRRTGRRYGRLLAFGR